MQTMTPKNWAKFQHYKDRCPPWIKLHREILDDFDYACLPLASKALAPLLWLLASDSKDGELCADPARLAHRLRWPIADIVAGLTPLIEKGFMVCDSDVLASCYQDAIPETEGETELEGEREKATVQQAAQRVSRFEEFWKQYPVKKGRADAEKKWRRMKLDPLADTLIAHVRHMLANDDGWQRGFIPHGSTYINGQLWTDEPKGPTTDTKREPSKQMQALNNLQEMRNGLAGGRGNGGFPAFGLLGDGSAASGRSDPGDGDGLV